MRFFVRTVELQNFSECARESGLTTSSVTRAISGLEESLKTPLLHRSTRKITLTEAGKAYYVRAKRILGELEEASAEASSLSQEPRGILRVTVPHGMGQLRLGPILPRFAQLYPMIETQVFLSDDYVDLLGESIDVAIRAGQLQDSNYRARKIEDYGRLLVASPKYLKIAPPLERPEDIASHSCLSYNFRMGQRTWYYRSSGKTKEIAVAGPLHINSLETIITGVKAGLGIGLLAPWSITNAIKKGDVVEVLPGYQFNVSPKFSEGLYAVYLGQRPPTKVRVFVDFIMKEWAS